MKKQDNSSSTSVKDKLKTVQEPQKKKEHFKAFKMWISYFISMSMKDRGKIPDNIGDKILISNNMYVTKLYLSSMLYIIEFGNNTPETTLGEIREELCKQGINAILDMTIKNRCYTPDLEKSGLRSRKAGWEMIAESPASSSYMRDRAVRCLYTVSLAESGVELHKTRVFLTIRAKTGTQLEAAEKAVFKCLNAMKCKYKPITTDIKNFIQYTSIISDSVPKGFKDTPDMITSNKMLSQLLANNGSFNDRKGLYMGINLRNGGPYYLDPSTISVARNFYICAPTGVGKTVIAINMAQSAYENGSAVCFWDIKGNEFVNFVKATNGKVISCRNDSTEYMNTFVMHKDECTDANAEAYYFDRFNFSKRQIIILSGINDKDTLAQLDEFLDTFLDSVYVGRGVLASNRNSWVYTEDLNPYVIYDMMVDYFQPSVIQRYPKLHNLLGLLRMYMSKEGSKSYVFRNEFNYSEILRARTLSFDFGIQKNGTVSSDLDPNLFNLKFLYTSKLNAEYTAYNYSNNRRTFKVLEESQIVSDNIMIIYAQEYTLRRSMMQDTLLLGNSVQALKSNQLAQPLIENTRGLLIGDLDKEARDFVLENFGITHLERFAKLPGSSPKYSHSFFFYNKMQDTELYPIIKAEIPIGEDGKPVPYKINTPVKEANINAGIN